MQHPVETLHIKIKSANRGTSFYIDTITGTPVLGCRHSLVLYNYDEYLNAHPHKRFKLLAFVTIC